MLIITSFLYISGTLPSKLGLIVNLVSPNAAFQSDLATVGIFFLYLFPGVKLGVYIAFNKVFRDQFLAYLRLMKLI
jgi:hypothetical protein